MLASCFFLTLTFKLSMAMEGHLPTVFTIDFYSLSQLLISVFMAEYNIPMQLTFYEHKFEVKSHDWIESCVSHTNQIARLNSKSCVLHTNQIARLNKKNCVLHTNQIARPNRRSCVLHTNQIARLKKNFGIRLIFCELEDTFYLARLQRLTRFIVGNRKFV